MPSNAASTRDYLHLLGARVRRVRSQRGMSRRILAHASGVSERYLAQLESGRGNASITILRAVASAMDVALDDLVDARAEQPPEYLVLRDYLRQASASELRRLSAACRAETRLAPREVKHIALLGLRGAGKSTLGQALAKRLAWPCVELSQEIERAAGCATSAIFAHGGQAAYRRLERAALSATLERHARAVIATGGSLVSEPTTFELLLTHCFTLWLKATPRQHMVRVLAQGDLRPMANHRNAMADLKRILAERTPLYRRADATIDTAGEDVQASLRQMLALEPIAALSNSTMAVT